MKALIISADGFEDSELVEPWQALQADGVETDLAAMEKGVILGKHGYLVEAKRSVDEVDASEYDLLVLPGGKAPESLRKEERVLELVRAFVAADKPIAAICHGPQVLISAGVLQGHTATSYKTVSFEMKRAGVKYVDREVVVDDGFITSRKPADLKAFIQAIRQRLGIEAK